MRFLEYVMKLRVSDSVRGDFVRDTKDAIKTTRGKKALEEI